MKFDEAGKPLPRGLRDVKEYAVKFEEKLKIFSGSESEKKIGKELVDKLHDVVDECLEYEETNNRINAENEENLKENEALSNNLAEEERKLDEQEKQIEEQLSSIDKELEAARNALSEPPTPEELALIEELENLKKDLSLSRDTLQSDRKRLQQCRENSSLVTTNCSTIRNDCAEVRDRIFLACNPKGLALGAGASGLAESQMNSASTLGGIGLANQALADELNRMSELRDYLKVKIPEIQKKHDENTKLLVETKEEVKEIKTNTQERGQKLNAIESRLAEIKASREAKETLSSQNEVSPKTTPGIKNFQFSTPPPTVGTNQINTPGLSSGKSPSSGSDVPFTPVPSSESTTLKK